MSAILGLILAQLPQISPLCTSFSFLRYNTRLFENWFINARQNNARQLIVRFIFNATAFFQSQFLTSCPTSFHVRLFDIIFLFIINVGYHNTPALHYSPISFHHLSSDSPRETPNKIIMSALLIIVSQVELFPFKHASLNSGLTNNSSISSSFLNESFFI